MEDAPIYGTADAEQEARFRYKLPARDAHYAITDLVNEGLPIHNPRYRTILEELVRPLVEERDTLARELAEAKQERDAAKAVAVKAVTCCMAGSATAQQIKDILIEKGAGVAAYQGALDAIIESLAEYTPLSATPQKEENQP